MLGLVVRGIYVQTRGRKLERIGNDLRASFLVETGDRWAELMAVYLTGHAEHITPNDELSVAYGREMDRKYRAFRGGTDGKPAMPEQAVEYYAKQMNGLVRFVADDRVLHWDNSKMMT